MGTKAATAQQAGREEPRSRREKNEKPQTLEAFRTTAPELSERDQERPLKP